MKIGVSTYSFSGRMGPGKMSLMDVISKTREMGFESIEICGIPAVKGESTEKTTKKIKAACAKARLPIASYTIGADLLNGSGGNLGNRGQAHCRDDTPFHSARHFGS